jgi:hypothetical protein
MTKRRERKQASKKDRRKERKKERKGGGVSQGRKERHYTSTCKEGTMNGREGR